MPCRAGVLGADVSLPSTNDTFTLRAHCASHGVEAWSFAGPDVADAVPVHCVHGVVVLQALDSGPRAERAARRRDPPITTAP